MYTRKEFLLELKLMPLKEVAFVSRAVSTVLGSQIKATSSLERTKIPTHLNICNIFSATLIKLKYTHKSLYLDRIDIAVA